MKHVASRVGERVKKLLEFPRTGGEAGIVERRLELGEAQTDQKALARAAAYFLNGFSREACALRKVAAIAIRSKVSLRPEELVEEVAMCGMHFDTRKSELLAGFGGCCEVLDRSVDIFARHCGSHEQGLNFCRIARRYGREYARWSYRPDVGMRGSFRIPEQAGVPQLDQHLSTGSANARCDRSPSIERQVAAKSGDTWMVGCRRIRGRRSLADDQADSGLRTPNIIVNRPRIMNPMACEQSGHRSHNKAVLQRYVANAKWFEHRALVKSKHLAISGAGQSQNGARLSLVGTRELLASIISAGRSASMATISDAETLADRGLTRDTYHPLAGCREMHENAHTIASMRTCVALFASTESSRPRSKRPAVTLPSDLEQQVKDLSERLKALEDYVEITQLVTQYGPAVDSGSLTAAPQLWEPGGVYDVAGVRRMKGREEIEDMLKGSGHQDAIMNGCGHVLTVPHVEVTGNEASGRSYSMMIRWDPEQRKFWTFRLTATHWHWRRTTEGWRISNRTNHLLDGSEEARALIGKGLPNVAP